MNKRDKRVFIIILKYCRNIAKANKTFHDDKNLFFDEEEGFIYRDTVSMSILQIGELANNLTDEMRKSHKDIPWRQIIDMRNIAAHHYEDWDYETVWDVAHSDVPELAKKIQAILDADEDAQ